jgi:capsular polysaccharide biosynthesis protein
MNVLETCMVPIRRLRRYPTLFEALTWCRDRALHGGLRLLRFASTPWPRWGPARTFFSAHALLKSGTAQGCELLPGQQVHKAPPGSLRQRAGLGQDGFQPWPVFWTRHSPARLVGQSLVLVDRAKRACIEAVYAPHVAPRDPAFRYYRLPPAEHLHGPWTSIVSQWTSSNYYHWLTDGLTRLALLDRFPAETRILAPGPLRPFQVDSLRCLGVLDRCQPVENVRHLLLDSYYFAAPTAMTGCDNPFGWDFLRDRLLPHADPAYHGPRRFYVQRVSVNRGLANEAEIQQFFRDLGWGIIDPATLSFAQQMKLFSQAEAVCGVHGAALANLLWANPGCGVVEICPGNYLNACYEVIAARLQLRYDYLICPADFQFVLRLPIHDLRRALKIQGWL